MRRPSAARYDATRMLVFRVMAVAAFGLWSLCAQPAPEPLIVIVDGSSAMNQSLGGARRIDIVRRVVQDLAAEFPGNVSLGLIFFGHRAAKDCGDVEVVEHIQSPVKDRREAGCASA